MNIYHFAVCDDRPEDARLYRIFSQFARTLSHIDIPHSPSKCIYVPYEFYTETGESRWGGNEATKLPCHLRLQRPC